MDPSSGRRRYDDFNECYPRTGAAGCFFSLLRHCSTGIQRRANRGLLRETQGAVAGAVVPASHIRARFDARLVCAASVCRKNTRVAGDCSGGVWR